MKKVRTRTGTRISKRTVKTATTQGHSIDWTFLTNHAHVLLCLYKRPDQRLRDVASAVGITERMVQRVISELSEAGYVRITKEGRCNRYTINTSLRLRHPLELQHKIGALLAVLTSAPNRRK